MAAASRSPRIIPRASIDLGASICCDGGCLTVTSVRADGKGSAFTVDVSNETRSKTTLARVAAGPRVNLERSLQAGRRAGRPCRLGHVDGLARILDINADGESRRFSFEVPEHLARYIAPKGSVALDGDVADRQRGERPTASASISSPTP